jgi:hypothetical protein
MSYLRKITGNVGDCGPKGKGQPDFSYRPSFYDGNLRRFAGVALAQSKGGAHSRNPEAFFAKHLNFRVRDGNPSAPTETRPPYSCPVSLL